jgi:hypothetical protein
LDSTNNAPIEIRKKNEEPETSNIVGSTGEVISKQLIQSEELQKERDRLRKIARQIYLQIKNGCQKDMCLNKNCRRNIFKQDDLAKLTTDKAILIHSMQLLESAKADPDIILCSDSITINSNNLDGI